VIGLDGTPTELLWNLLFCNNTHFETYRVIRREDYPAFLNSAMNMDLVQLGNGAHHYGGGEPSPYDKHRFATVKLRENERFALVTSKNALEHYHTSRLLADYVHRDENPDEDSNRRYPRFKARHYGTIRSSNDLAEEPIGVVAGTPHPGDEVIQLWSAFCGTVGEPKGEGPERQYGKGQTEKIYNHFVHNQIAQAVLRFGRDGQVINSGGSTVYVITKALPRWLEVEHSIDIRKNEAEISIISTIISQDEGEAQLKYDTFTVSNISEEVELSWKKVRKTLEMLVDEKVLTVSRDHAKGGADLYYWAGPERIRYDKKADRHLMLGNNNLFVLPNL
jgi:hypothetical protein